MTGRTTLRRCHHVWKSEGFFQLLSRLFYEEQKSVNPKVLRVVESIKKGGFGGNLGRNPGMEPGYKRDIWEGESVLFLFIMRLKMRHKAIIWSLVGQQGVVPVKATTMRLGLLSQLHQPNLRKGNGNQSHLRRRAQETGPGGGLQAWAGCTP